MEERFSGLERGNVSRGQRVCYRDGSGGGAGYRDGASVCRGERGCYIDEVGCRDQ